MSPALLGRVVLLWRLTMKLRYLFLDCVGVAALFGALWLALAVLT